MANDTDSRIVKISSQMQVRIPADLYKRYKFGDRAVCVPTKTGIEFRPVKGESEGYADLLQSLVDQGLSGEELVSRFRESSVKYAVVELQE